NVIMPEKEIPENIDLHYIASQNAKILSQLAALRLRLDVAVLADEQINVKLCALLKIAKGGILERGLSDENVIPAPPGIDDFDSGGKLFGESEAWPNRGGETQSN
ncbi:MAG: hypothetical protein WBX25_28345, partial [Rhodomicrobium sp.]